MQLLISDANILIDLETGRLLVDLFRPPYRFSVPDILFYEELEEQHADLPGMGLALETLSGESMIDAFRLVDLYRKPSRYDCFALALAKQEQCLLLTGDKDLREAAEKEFVTVKGTLWVFEELITHGIITLSKARFAYKSMETSGRRLPWEKARRRLDDMERGMGDRLLDGS